MARDQRIKFYISSCIKKTRFDNEAKAKKKANEYGLRHYYCSICCGFHLTSQKENKK